MSLKGKTMFISGASRGIGLEIAKRAAADGANIALIAKTAEPHPKLPGTVYTAAKELEEAGGQALPIVGDIRDEQSVADAVAHTVEQFGGIDALVHHLLDRTGRERVGVRRALEHGACDVEAVVRGRGAGADRRDKGDDNADETGVLEHGDPFPSGSSTWRSRASARRSRRRRCCRSGGT